MTGRSAVSWVSRLLLPLILAAISPLMNVTPVAAATTLLQESFESGAPGWTTTGFWHIQDHPETISVKSPDINPTLVTLPDSGQLPQAFAGTHAAWFGEVKTGTFCGTDFTTIPQTPKDGCTSTQVESGELTSPGFSLMGASSAEVQFQAWWEIESVNADTFDIMTVDYSPDNGVTWKPAGKLNPTNNPAGHHDQSYAAEGIETVPHWHHNIADISGAAGQSAVKVRFTFNTTDRLFQGFRGLLIDNVAITTPFDSPAPSILSLDPNCVSPGTAQPVAINGSHFVIGSKVQVDGADAGGAVPSDNRMEFIPSHLAEGTHAVQVVSPNGSKSNAASLKSAPSCSNGPTPPVGGPIAFLESLGNGNFCWTCVANGVVQALVGKPVNTATGNLTASFRDVAIPGRGLPIDFNRTYNSLVANADGPLGFGWTFSYGASISQDSGTGKVTIHQENASEVTFTPTGGGHYSAPPRFLATLVKNADGSLTFTRHEREVMLFSPSGQLLKETDLNGYTTALSYDSKGHLATVTDPAGRSLALSYKQSHITRLTDPIGRTVTFDYDNPRGDLRDVEDVNGGHSRFTYDAQHRMLTMTDPRGGTVTNHYDASNRVDWQSDELGRKTSFAYTPTTTTITDPKGNMLVEEYQFGEKVAETRGAGTPQAATWHYAYDNATIGVTAVTDPNGHTTTATYDPHGNPLTATDALGRATVNAWDALNDLASVTDPKGVKTTMAYDARGNLVSRSTPLSGTSQIQVTTYHHNDSAHPGDVTSTTDPEGQTWPYEYDAAGDVTSTIDPLGDKATSDYNTIGWITSRTSPKGNVQEADRDNYRTTIGHNPFGDITEITDPLGHKELRRYDRNRKLIEVRDGDGNVTRYTHDAANQLTATVRPDGTTLATDYNPDGTVLRQFDGNHNATTYGYDALARVTAVTDPLGKTTASTYDSTGNLRTVADPQGQLTTYGYDSANQVTAITYSDGQTPNVTNITYDADGQRIGMTDGTGTWAWKWDSLHRLSSVTEGNNGAVSYQYDRRNLLTQVTYPDGSNVIRGYDKAGRWVSVQDWLGHNINFQYDANGNLNKETVPSSVPVIDTFRYDHADRLTAVRTKNDTGHRHGDGGDEEQGTTLFSADYDRDANNQLISDSSQPEKNQDYKYTSLNQLCYAGSSLTDACSSPPHESLAYQYDAAGNVIRLGSTEQTFNAADELCWSSPKASSKSCSAVPPGATTYGYDIRGNRTSVTPPTGGSIAFGYDQANRLTSYSQESTTASYRYAGDGLRMAKRVSGVETRYVWDVSGGVSRLLGEGNAGQSTSYVYGPGGVPVEKIDGKGVFFYHHDQLGSTRLITDSSGKSLATYTYDPYGNMLDSTGTITNPLRYAHEYQDSESGLYYLRARYYDPRTAQFLTKDPAFNVTKAAYRYVAGNPLNQTDPSGLDDPCAGAGAFYGNCQQIATCDSIESCSTAIDAYKKILQYWTDASHECVPGGGGGLTYSAPPGFIPPSPTTQDAEFQLAHLYSYVDVVNFKGNQLNEEIRITNVFNCQMKWRDIGILAAIVGGGGAGFLGWGVAAGATAGGTGAVFPILAEQYSC